jgi:hypothetical protein
MRYQLLIATRDTEVVASGRFSVRSHDSDERTYTQRSSSDVADTMNVDNKTIRYNL